MFRVVAPFVVGCLIPQFSIAGDRITGRDFATRSEVIARNGMVATSQPLATQAALDVLQQGGNAVDAAIAANAMLALTEPTGCGIGGDLMAIVWDAKKGELQGLLGIGRSPRSLTLAEFQKQNLKKIPSRGPLPVTVPGCVDAWCELHARYGKLPLSAVLAPAIRYAREGFPVSELIAHYWQASVRSLAKFEGFSEQFTIDGKAPEKGDVFKNPNLATTLEAIATGGRDAFYRGEIAGRIADYLKKHGGFLDREDLASHTSEWVKPVSANYRGYDVFELPPPTQGIAALQILEILEGYDVKAMGFLSADYVHAFVEAKKLAFEDRAHFYSDPAFGANPVAGLISAEYAAKRRELVNMKRAAARYAAGNPALEEGDTVYLTTADSAGNMVSLIQSNYRGMGSGMTPPGLGFILHDRGELFDLTEGRANTYAPGKRPFQTIIPAFIMKDGKPWVSFGVMGGATQPQVHAQIVCNLIDFGMNLQEAGDAPRILHSGSSEPTGERMEDGGVVSIERGVEFEVLRELVGRGHKIQTNVGDFGGYQAILWDAARGVYFGASESRKDGQAAGY
jgi:gamma-glutamyltranspeptidase / glutathione hydrolase